MVLISVNLIQYIKQRLHRKSRTCCTLSELPSTVSLLQRHTSLTKKKAKPVQAYLLNRDIAERVAEKLIEGHPEIPIIESCPGPSILTRALLNHNVKKLAALYSNKEWAPYLQELQKSVGKQRLLVTEAKPYLGTSSLDLGLATLDFFKKHITPWGSDIASKFFTISPSSSGLMHTLLDHLTKRKAIFSLGRTEIYVFTLDMYAKTLCGDQTATFGLNNPARVQKSVLFKTFFDAQVILKVPVDEFYPNLLARPWKAKGKIKQPDKDNYCLVKLVPKRHLHNIIDENDLPAFVLFVQYIMEKKNDRVIPKMEKLAPTCGLKLISEGHTMTETTGTLSVETIIQLFKDFRSRPEYTTSSIYIQLTSTDSPSQNYLHKPKSDDCE